MTLPLHKILSNEAFDSAQFKILKAITELNKGSFHNTEAYHEVIVLLRKALERVRAGQDKFNGK